MEIRSQRLVLRPLVSSDYGQWSEVRTRCAAWLRVWEPLRAEGSPDPATDPRAFTARCNTREREKQLGTGFAYAMFLGGRFVGEINVSSVQRGPFQSGNVGYWVDEQCSGLGLVPEGLVAVFGDIFDRIGLHRLEIAIIPRNARSIRVVEKLDIRFEGVAERYLEIYGQWEDHGRYAITAEEWSARKDELVGLGAGAVQQPD